MTFRNSFFDASADLVHPMFQGVYKGVRYHDPDLEHVLRRARENKVKNIMIPGKSLSHSTDAVNLANAHENIFCSVGCSLLNSHEFVTQGPKFYGDKMMKLIENNRHKVLAIGECGLNYDKLDKCDKVTQINSFKTQLELARFFNLPVLIRCRNAFDDLIKIYGSQPDHFREGMVLGFDSDGELARRLQRLNLLLGISGCSLRSKELLDEITDIPTESLVLMTDSPGCELNFGKSRSPKTTFPSEPRTQWSPDKRVKGRNEPGNIIQVLEVLAALKNERPNNIAYKSNQACESLFFSKHKNL